MPKKHQHSSWDSSLSQYSDAEEDVSIAVGSGESQASQGSRELAPRAARGLPPNPNPRVGGRAGGGASPVAGGHAAGVSRRRGPQPAAPRRAAVERRFFDLDAAGGFQDSSDAGSQSSPPRRRRRTADAPATKYRNWVFTLNNYSQEDVVNLSVLVGGGVAIYCAFQGERGESGTRHLQGVVCFRHARRLQGVKDVVGRRAHVEPMRGTIQQARDYCSKVESRDPEGPAFAEHGEFPAGAGQGRGSRTDCKAVVDLIRGGAGFRQIAEEAPAFALRAERGIRAIQAAFSGSRNWPTVVKWYHGPTGCGKSRAAFEEAGPDAYVKMPGNKWWDGYEGQENVVIDDYRCDFSTFSELLRLFDRYPMRVEIKGGSTQFLAKTIWVTTPYDPLRTWTSQSQEKLDQLIRRITQGGEHPENIKYFGPPEGPLVDGFVLPVDRPMRVEELL